jgi:hypothetical protein
MTSLPAPVIVDYSATGKLALPKTLRSVMVATFCAYLALALYAAAVRHGLFADGAYVLLRVTTEGGFVRFQPSRLVVHFLHQLPTIAAIRFGVADLYVLTFIYGLTLHLLPLVATLACYAILPQDKKLYFVFPYLHFVAGTLGSALAPVAEAPLASAIFWILFYLILFDAVGVWSKVALFALAASALLLHEVYAFLGIALAGAAMYRRSNETQFAARMTFGALAVWFFAVAAVQFSYILDPFDVANRESLVSTSIQLVWLRFGVATNMPVVLGLMALGACLVAWVWVQRKRVAPPAAARRAVHCCFALAAALAIALPLYSINFIDPRTQFAARNQSAYVSLALAVAVAMTLRIGRPTVHWQRWLPTAAIAYVAIGSLGWLFVGLSFWARCVADTEFVLSTRTGLISWEEALSRVPERDRRIFWRFHWGWTLPSMSILLAPEGQVSAIIDVPPQTGWKPFDPAKSADLPRSALFSTDHYVRAIRN